VLSDSIYNAIEVEISVSDKADSPGKLFRSHRMDDGDASTREHDCTVSHGLGSRVPIGTELTLELVAAAEKLTPSSASRQSSQVRLKVSGENIPTATTASLRGNERSYF